MENDKIKIIFFGTPHFAEKILKDLIAAGYNIAAVFTQSDKKVGRNRETKKSAVKELAEKHSIPVFEPQNLGKGNAKEDIAKLQPDVIIVAAYGKILPKDILEIPKFGAINIHASLLPKFRGASPIQEAILSGEEKTGLTLMLMNEKLDAGEIINQEEIAIGKNDNTLTLTEKLAEASGKILIETLPLWISGAIKAIPQNEKEATYCRTIEKGDGKIDWSEPAETIFKKWKAYHPWPGIFTFFSLEKGKKRLKLVEIEAKEKRDIGESIGKVLKYKDKIAVQTKKGLIVLKKIQLEGKKTMSADDFSKGHKDFLGSVLA
ncbi:MAG: methionyl-tRNA formyltransferase [Candidatus Moranbacteria bacterium]|nr:methionyl-tRNA formyltransferase [Candidatus Moranbacteria bacterium]